LFLTLFVVGGVLCAGVVGESIAQEYRPSITRGLDLVATGKFVIPEIVPAAIRGYVVGALMLAASAVCAFATLRLRALPPQGPSLNTPFKEAPFVASLSSTVTLPILFGFGLMVAVALVGMWRRLPSWAPPVVPAVLIASLPLCLGDSAAGVETLLLILFAGIALWRWDVLTAMIGISVYFAGVLTAPLLTSHVSRFQLAGMAIAACGLIPAACGAFAYRKFLRMDSRVRSGTIASSPAS
jgi:hypothetical protein